METLNATYLSRAEFWLFTTILVYFLMNGAQIFETAVLVPKWTAAPPESFRLLANPEGASLKTFWIVFHSLHEITFILAIIFCWKLDPVRNWILLLFLIHFFVRVWTLTYFAPNIIGFQKMANSSEAVAGLLNKTTLWQNLNYLRVAIFLGVSLGLIPLLIKVVNMKLRLDPLQ